MKIYILGFIRLTHQYAGGIVAGFGLGAIAMKVLISCQGAQVLESSLLPLGALLLVFVGAVLALSEQRRLDAENNE